MILVVFQVKMTFLAMEINMSNSTPPLLPSLHITWVLVQEQVNLLQKIMRIGELIMIFLQILITSEPCVNLCWKIPFWLCFCGVLLIFYGTYMKHTFILIVAGSYLSDVSSACRVLLKYLLNRLQHHNDGCALSQVLSTPV